MTLLDHVLAFVFGLLLPTLQAWPRPSDQEAAEQAEPQTFEEKRQAYWGTAVVHAVIGGLTLLAWRAGDRSLNDLGVTAAPTHLAIGFALTVLCFLFYGADTWEKLRPSRLPESRERWRKEAPHMPRTWAEVAHAVPVGLAGAVCEEIVFRGFLISYVVTFAGTSSLGIAVAIGLSAIAFGVLHLNQGARAAVLVSALAAIVGLIFIVTGSLWIPIAIHMLVNLVGLSLGPWFMRDYSMHAAQ